MNKVHLLMADNRVIQVTGSEYITDNPAFGRVLEFVEPPKGNALENARRLANRYGYRIQAQNAQNRLNAEFVGVGL